jgi:hypothetical protein
MLKMIISISVIYFVIQLITIFIILHYNKKQQKKDFKTISETFVDNFMKVVGTIIKKNHENESSIMDVFKKALDKQQKISNSLSVHNKYSDIIQKEIVKLVTVKSQLIDSININNKSIKQSANLIKSRTVDLDNKIKKLNVTLKRSK